MVIVKLAGLYLMLLPYKKRALKKYDELPQLRKELATFSTISGLYNWLVGGTYLFLSSQRVECAWAILLHKAERL